MLHVEESEATVARSHAVPVTQPLPDSSGDVTSFGSGKNTSQSLTKLFSPCNHPYHQDWFVISGYIGCPLGEGCF